MKRKRILVIASIGLVLVLAFFYAPVVLTRLMFGSGGGRGRVMDTWEAANNGFKVRVIEYEEKHPVLLHRFNYVFQTSPAANDWREIMDTWTDDDVPIPHESVTFLTDNVGYISMGEIFAATIDGGRSWSVWDAKKEVPNWQCCNQAFIKEVHIASDGRGEMLLSPGFNQIPVTKLNTKDFGMNWNPE
jgi:photosystem II stability/assembly factor-like uncharacterized protein